MNKLGERLRELRLENNISQSELAKILGLSQTAIGKWELKQRTPNLDIIIELCKFFKVSSDYLIGIVD